MPLAHLMGLGEWDVERGGHRLLAVLHSLRAEWSGVPLQGLELGFQGAVMVLDPSWTRGPSTPSPFLIAALILISESPFDEVLFPVCTPLLTGLFFL